jgi:dephospho-CoA kinase
VIGGTPVRKTPPVGLVWITGNAGTGKSELCTALARRGCRTIDSDLGMAVWENRTTGDFIRAEEAGRVSQRWFADHRWVLPRSRVEDVARTATAQSVFLCGLVQNDEELWDLFDVTICLVLDDVTIRERIARRTGNPFGKAPAELEAILAINGPLVARYTDLGATLIDASRPVEEVADDVVRACERGGLDVQRS